MNAIATAAQHKRQETELVSLMEAAKVAPAAITSKPEPPQTVWIVSGFVCARPKGLLVRRGCNRG